ncbi:GNAT family N-acetyltransferase [Bacillus lacus]|uniref:GNAT family N-acetyltransferase n=1 Tax=Metabacillus lacus TaxID=1983721 RepID=A0A7X2LXX8_9BACI|nr:GNAT family N-acetyltransferase [Metabacillus lacus]MRX73025.1 GNAT family N-acetyltransferase [Metabacillus lacus]
MEIKRAGLDDLDAVAQLFDEYRVFYNKESDVKAAKAFITDRIANNESVIFLAHEGDTPIGFVQLYPIFTSIGMQCKWLLNDLFVNSKHRRTGAGKALMNAAKEHAIFTEAAGLQLETAMDNTRAQALYESLGYKKEKETYFYTLTL